MGGVRCLGLFPKKKSIFFYPFPKYSVDDGDDLHDGVVVVAKGAAGTRQPTWR